MELSAAKIEEAKDDTELVDLLSRALAERFTPDIQSDVDRLLAALGAAPRGLRAMAGIHDLDVSMTLDDLAWHFGNHNDERFLRETEQGLLELGAVEVAELFHSAWEIVKPHLGEIKTKSWEIEDPHEYLEKIGIQSKVDPLNERMWAICEKCGDLGLLHYWCSYARKYPERCLNNV